MLRVYDRAALASLTELGARQIPVGHEVAARHHLHGPRSGLASPSPAGPAPWRQSLLST